MNIRIADVTAAHGHTNRFDGQVHPLLQFFLNYYFAIIVSAGMLLFLGLWWRQARKNRRLAKTT